jgi:hypothetical protein
VSQLASHHLATRAVYTSAPLRPAAAGRTLQRLPPNALIVRPLPFSFFFFLPSDRIEPSSKSFFLPQQKSNRHRWCRRRHPQPPSGVKDASHTASRRHPCPVVAAGLRGWILHLAMATSRTRPSPSAPVVTSTPSASAPPGPPPTQGHPMVHSLASCAQGKRRPEVTPTPLTSTASACIARNEPPERFLRCRLAGRFRTVGAWLPRPCRLQKPLCTAQTCPQSLRVILDFFISILS